MSRRLTLSNKLLAVGIGFLVPTLVVLAAALVLSWQLRGGAAAADELAQLRVAAAEWRPAGGGASGAAAAWSRSFSEGGALAGFAARNAALTAGLARARTAWAAAQAAPRSAAAWSVLHADLAGLHAALARTIAQRSALLRALLFLLGALVLAAAVASFFLSQRLVLGPIRRLRRAFAAVREGRLETRLALHSGDEFGQLAAGFNLMTNALRGARAELERTVREKTTSLEEQNQRLAALYAVSALAASAPDLQALTHGFIEQVRRAAGCDGVIVRWSDEGNAYYTLLAAEGVPPALVAHEQCLPTGSCRCGQPQEDARLRVFPVEAADKATGPFCAHAGFRTVVSVPVELHQRVLGELTLFYRARAALPDATRALLTTLGHHLAVAMENLRVAGLEREAAITVERKLIARELHDSIAQSLSFLKIQARLLRGALAKGDAAARDRSLGELDVGIQECLADVRELLVHFRARTQDEDIEAALRATLSKFEHQTHIPAALRISGRGAPLEADVQIQVLHVVQEALSNVRKHAGASRVELRVQRHPGWRFEVCDDGAGFDAVAHDGGGVHVGLEIMRERAQRMGARLEVDSTLGTGTCVRLELPPARPHAVRQAPEIRVVAT